MIIHDFQLNIGYAATILIGIILGLIGGGGSILTVPVLVYLFNLNPVLSTSYSLFIVGISSIFGVASFARKNQVRYQTAFFFGLPSILTVYLTRKFVVPNIPEHVHFAESITINKDLLIMLLFAVLMVVTAIAMIRKKPANSTPTNSQNRGVYWGVIIL